jgi:hypothetical protein
MAQTAVNDEPTQAYEGKLYDRAGRSISRLASELIYFGKAVSLLAVTDLAVGGASEGQSVKLPAAAADITSDLLEGVAVADPSLERLSVAGVPANYGAYTDESAVRVLRNGRIWVVTTAEIIDVTVGVYVRWQVPGGTPPTESLGSFAGAASANHALVPTTRAKWRGAATIGGVFFGLLELGGM